MAEIHLTKLALGKKLTPWQALDAFTAKYGRHSHHDIHYQKRVYRISIDQLQDSSDGLPGNQQYRLTFACSDTVDINSVTMTMAIKSASQTFIEVNFDGVFSASQRHATLVVENHNNFIQFSVALAKKLGATHLLLNNYYDYAGDVGRRWLDALGAKLDFTYYVQHLQQVGFNSTMLGKLDKSDLMIVSNVVEAKLDMLRYVNLLKRYQSAQIVNSL
jgi:hypothetical protein